MRKPLFWFTASLSLMLLLPPLLSSARDRPEPAARPAATTGGAVLPNQMLCGAERRRGVAA